LILALNPSVTKLTAFLPQHAGTGFARSRSRTIKKPQQSLWCAPMLAIDIPLLIAASLIGFAGGYLVRDLKSRQKHRRWREKYWYGRPQTSARTPLESSMSLERSISVPASQGALSTRHRHSR